MSGVVVLPLAAITREDSSETYGTSDLHNWLESLKPGWASRFAPAFDRTGFTDLRKLATLQCSDREYLEEELRIQGARLVQLNQLSNAINCLANVDKTPRVTPKVSFSKDFESPMAIYFGESYPNLFNHFNEEVASNASSRNTSLSKWHAKTTDSPMMLPYKSPMTAFFDGNDLDDFCMSPQSINLYENSDRASNDDSLLKLAPLVIEAQQIAWPVDEQKGKYTTALQRKSSRKTSRVTWADDLRAKAALPLVELIDVADSTESSFARCMWKLAQDPAGTFEVQRAFEQSNDDERSALAAQLRGHVYEATQCPHANHVLRKVVTTMPPSAWNFVVLELLSLGEAGILNTARHRYGCRIMECLLTRLPRDRAGCMVKCLLAESIALSTHMYGNFVVQRLLEAPDLGVVQLIREKVHSNLMTLGTNFYGCAVVGKMLHHSSDAERLSLARAIIGVNGLMATMRRHRLGKETVEAVLATMHGSDKIAAQAQLAAPALKMSKRGRAY